MLRGIHDPEGADPGFLGVLERSSWVSFSGWGELGRAEGDDGVGGESGLERKLQVLKEVFLCTKESEWEFIIFHCKVKVLKRKRKRKRKSQTFLRAVLILSFANLGWA